ncbi:MAG: serine/threonine protein kinase [Pyrinomonadaceae bacterium]|nr:serine/threonine protein kinase [Pyrinomonadaceae bacterium]
MLLREGDVIGRSYTVERFLGEGAFAEVYRVKHRNFGRQAMKVFKQHGTIEEIDQLLEEANILSGIGHRNVIRVFHADIIETDEGGRGFFTMEYVAGGSLQQFWRSFGDQLVPVETVVDIAKQVCQGLSIAHCGELPIVHRDIKPQNILVGYDAGGLRACVSDFGLARRVNPLMLQVSARGTRCFKAPETFRDPMGDSYAGDVWAVGVTLYLMLTDQFPYALGQMESLGIKCFDCPLVPPSRYNIRVDPALDRILFRALALEKEKRYSNAKEMLEDLSEWKLQPVETGNGWSESSSSESKSIYGEQTSADESAALQMVEQAIQISRQRSRLGEAADLMEEAFNKWPALREEYEPQLKNWRRGVVM